MKGKATIQVFFIFLLKSSKLYAPQEDQQVPNQCFYF